MAHGTDICPDCLFEKCCGKRIQNDECHFIKKSEMAKLVQEETTKIEEWAQFTAVILIRFVLYNRL